MPIIVSVWTKALDTGDEDERNESQSNAAQIMIMTTQVPLGSCAEDSNLIQFNTSAKMMDIYDSSPERA